MVKISEEMKKTIENTVADRLSMYAHNPDWSEIVNRITQFTVELLEQVDEVCDVYMDEEEFNHCMGVLKNEVPVD